MSRDSAKAHYTKQPGDPDEGFITASDAQAAIDDIYDDMSAPAVIADGSVTSGKIAADAVGSAQIATGAVGESELATDAVTSDKIADGAVSNAHVASDAAIAASKVAGTAVTQADTGTVTNGMLAGSIAKTKVAGTAITAADTGTVTGTMIAAGAVDNGNLAANAVNEAKIASGAVTTVKIADDAVTSDKIADNAVTAAQIAANAVGASELADNAVDTAAIAADAVTADKIANDTITAAELAAGSVGTSELADDSVTAAKILDGTITANEIQNASITGVKLVNDTITATQIAANAVGASELADNAVDTAAVADGAVTRAKLAGNLLTATQSNFEVDTTGWAASNVTLTRTTASYKSGAASMRVASSTDSSTTKRARTSTRPAVVAGKTYTICASLKGDGTTFYRMTVLWYNAASGGSIVGTVNGAYVNASAGWFDERMELVAPATATHCEINVYLRNETLTGGYVDVDEVGIWEGVGGSWAAGGTATDATGVPFVKTLYVDSAGSDANPATSALPVASISKAVDLAGVTASVIKVRSTPTSPIRDASASGIYVPAYLPSLTIESGTPGVPWYILGCTPVTSGWASVGGGVYSRALSVNTDRCYVATLSETIGDRRFILALDENTSTPTTPGEGECGWASNVLYVKLPGSADPNTHTIHIPHTSYILQSDCPSLTIRDARATFANFSAFQALSGHLAAYDSGVAHSGSSCWATTGSGNMTLQRCYGWRAGNDGFNVHGTGKTLLIDCDGSYNDDEGASAHDTAYMEIAGGQYRYNKQSGTGNVNDCTVVIGGNPLFERNQRDGIPSPEGGGIAAFDNCRTSIVSATCANNTGSGVRSTSSVAVQVDGLLSGTGQGNTSADYGI